MDHGVNYNKLLSGCAGEALAQYSDGRISCAVRIRWEAKKTLCSADSVGARLGDQAHSMQSLSPPCPPAPTTVYVYFL